MTREEALEQEVQALKDLVNIQKQIIEALKLKAEVLAQPVQVPYVAPYIPPTILHPNIIVTPAVQPWPGYPAPYVGDLPPGMEPFKVTCGTNVEALPGVVGGVQPVNYCVSAWQTPEQNESIRDPIKWLGRQI